MEVFATHALCGHDTLLRLVLFAHFAFDVCHHKMIVLGIDPGLNTTGYGVVEFSKREPRID